MAQIGNTTDGSSIRFPAFVSTMMRQMVSGHHTGPETPALREYDEMEEMI